MSNMKILLVFQKADNAKYPCRTRRRTKVADVARRKAHESMAVGAERFYNGLCTGDATGIDHYEEGRRSGDGRGKRRTGRRGDPLGRPMLSSRSRVADDDDINTNISGYYL
jgi:hypothetical protein